MVDRQADAGFPHFSPVELTAPSIQRLARKGLNERLTDSEREELCQCVVFHIDSVLEQRRIPKALKRSA